MANNINGIIHVGEKDTENLLALDIVAFQIAEGGAMGRPGGVYFVTSDKKVYYTSYVSQRDYMPLDKLMKVFPPLKDFRHGLMGRGIHCPTGWRHDYLGMGNHLLVREDLHGEFTGAAKVLLAEHPGTILYNQWLEAILSVL